MNRIILLLLLSILLISCQGKKESSIKNPDLCETLVKVGSNQICLGKFEGMKEVYSDPFVKSHMNRAEPEVTDVIGVYLTLEKFDQIDIQNNLISNNGEVFVDRFKLYVAKNMINVYSSSKELELLYNRTKDFFKKPEEKKDLLNNNFKDVNYDIPTFIEAHEIDSNAWTVVTVIKYQAQGIETLRVSLITAMVLNGKLIYCNYINEYKNDESISSAIKKNTEFTKMLLKQNN